MARDNMQVEGVELIWCFNGCVTSLGTGRAYAMKCNECACVTVVKELLPLTFSLKGDKNMIILILPSKRVSKHGFTFKVVNLLCLLKLIKHR